MYKMAELVNAAKNVQKLPVERKRKGGEGGRKEKDKEEKHKKKKNKSTAIKRQVGRKKEKK